MAAQRRGVAGADGATYTLTDADLGRTIACRLSATNAAGTGDATSEALYVSAAAAPIAAPAPPAAQPQPQPAAPKGISLEERVQAVVEPQGGRLHDQRQLEDHEAHQHRPGLADEAGGDQSATGSVKVTVRSTKKLKKGQKMTLKVRYEHHQDPDRQGQRPSDQRGAPFDGAPLLSLR